MFKNSYQNGLLSIFYSCGSNPLAIWDLEVKNGHIKRLIDNEVNSVVLEIVSTNVATTYITCPKNNQTLGIKLPFLVMIVKNLKRYFTFEITIIDDKKMRRRFRISNFQSATKIKPFFTSMPIGLAGGWNQIQFNLADFTRRAYGTQLIETLRVQVHANARIRRIYFSARLYTEEELPQDYKLYLPLERKQKKGKVKPEQGTPAPTSEGTAPAETLPPVESKRSKTLSKKSGTIATPTSAEPEKTAEDAQEETPAPEEGPATDEAPQAEATGEEPAEGEKPAEEAVEATAEDKPEDEPEDKPEVAEVGEGTEGADVATGAEGDATTGEPTEEAGEDDKDEGNEAANEAN